jgi:carbonic anhydrase
MIETRMRLFEAIVEANHRALAGDEKAGLRPSEWTHSLPIVALTCIDPRLNPLMPEVLGVPEEQFIWLRNAGNIIFDPTSSMTRTLALACAIKGGREIAIIGHTDCKVRQTSTLELTDRFKALGIERARLPENLNEFFGLFASERQNVLRGVGFVRQSPLIGPKIPVHGLLVDIQNGRLEWIVNGYQALSTATSEMAPALAHGTSLSNPLAALEEFKLGEMKFPDFKIGESISAEAALVAHKTESPATLKLESKTKPSDTHALVDAAGLYKILGEDRKVYGPVSGKDLLQWLAEGRIDVATLAQKLGYHDWKPLATFLREKVLPEIPIPPSLPGPLKMPKSKRKH